MRIFRGVGGQLDVRQQFDALSVHGHGRGMTQPRQFFALEFTLALAEPVLLKDDIRRVDDDQARVAIDDQQIILTNHAASLASSYDRGYVEAASNNCCVRGLATDIGHESGEDAALEVQHVGRRHIVGHQHQRVLAGEVARLRAERRHRADPPRRRRRRAYTTGGLSPLSRA